MADILPKNDEMLDAMMVTLITNLTLIATEQNVTPDQLTALNKDRNYWRYALDNNAVAKTYGEAYMEWKNNLRRGTGDVTPPPEPPVPFPTLPPAAVEPGFEKRLRDLIQQVKKNPKYTKGIGEHLGIVAPTEEFDPEAGQPVLTLALVGTGVEVRWTKGKYSAIRIEVDRGLGAGWEFLAVDTVPHYIDTAGMATPSAMWKYRARYLLDDVIVGAWSAVVDLAVPGA